ncbi:IS21 family transposase, partial [Staphylococcus aureus]
QALLRHAGGDRLMAQVLALSSTAGLDEVLVAAELALEHAGPSGRISPEHVANVLARLTAPERPPNVDTPLSTTTPPQADPGRYDRLRRLAEQEVD